MKNASDVQRALLDWYAEQQRALPWRQDITPYRVLVSEFMLQQTQAERVAPRFLAFLEQFPDYAALATASIADVLRAWSGLGYNSRALRLQRIARQVIATGGGELPSDPGTLRQLPGVGPYTAAAIACFAFGVPLAAVDTNVNRVLQRVYHGQAGTTPKLLAHLAATILPLDQAAAWNQALMDLGALVCSARQPSYARCPLAAWCLYRQEQSRDELPAPARSPRKVTSQPFAGSNRYYRGRVLRALSALDGGDALPLATLGQRVKEDFTAYDTAWLEGVLDRLAQDGLIEVERDGERVTAHLPEG